MPRNPPTRQQLHALQRRLSTDLATIVKLAEAETDPPRARALHSATRAIRAALGDVTAVEKDIKPSRAATGENS